MYNPKRYWASRDNITPHEVPKRVSSYIWRHIEPYETLLDFGCGDGRLSYIFTGKDVTGYDIVDRNPPYRLISQLDSTYDVVVASKVFLHIPPDDIADAIYGLRMISNKVVVWDAVGQDAPHVFDHDYSEYGDMVDVERWSDQLLFCYAN